MLTYEDTLTNDGPQRVAYRDGVPVGRFYRIGTGQHSDLAFTWRNPLTLEIGEVVFPMVGGWPTTDEADRIVEVYA